MSYISFYRKWRPQNFKEIVGQQYVVRTLRNAISKNRLSHCYIFCGPRGTGKTSTARILAKALNCIDGPTPDPCNKCENCVSISNGNSVDVIEIDAASNRGINEIRELKEKVKYLPSVLRKKVYIIDEVHMLTTEAFNALLKVLEEPPEHVLFIMATTEPHKVISTIMSRCQRFDFYPIPVDKIKQRLMEISESEDISISDSALSIISKYADGSQRDADGILEQLASYVDGSINVQDVTSLLGIVDMELLFEFTNILIEKNLNHGLLFINRLIGSNQNIKVFVSEFIDHLYGLYVVKNLDNPLEIVDIGLDYKDRFLSQSRQLSSKDLEFFIDLFTDLYKEIRWSEGSKILFKSTVIKAINSDILKKQEMESKFTKLESEIELIKKEIKKLNTLNSNSKLQLGREKEYFNKVGEDDKVEDEYRTEQKEKEEKGEKKKKDEREKLLTTEYKRRVDEDERSDSMQVNKATKVGIETGRDTEINTIYHNWNDICFKLRSKKISIYAMFVESQWCRIDGNVLCFYLDSSKKWHKDHLNRENNANLISKIIEDVTGRSYRVKFELEDGSKNISKGGFKGTISREKVLDKLGGEGKKDKDLKNKKDSQIDYKDDSLKRNKEIKDLEEEDIFDYFERKFDIKE